MNSRVDRFKQRQKKTEELNKKVVIEKTHNDDTYQKAVEFIASKGRVSTSAIQREFQIGYNKALALVERMEKEGLVSQPKEGTLAYREMFEDKVKEYLDGLKDVASENVVENVQTGGFEMLSSVEEENEETADSAPEEENEEQENEPQEEKTWRDEVLESWSKWAEENNQEIKSNQEDDVALSIELEDKEEEKTGKVKLDYKSENDVDITCDVNNKDNDKYFEKLLLDAKEKGMDTINLKEGNSDEFNNKLVEAAQKVGMNVLLNGQPFEKKQKTAEEKLEELKAKKEQLRKAKQREDRIARLKNAGVEVEADKDKKQKGSINQNIDWMKKQKERT